MDLFRRLLTGILAIALTQFGVMAAAPAHAHAGEIPHGMHAVAAEAVLTDQAGVYDAHGDQTVALPLDTVVPDQNQGEGRGDTNGSEPLTHVHVYPEIAPAGAHTAAFLPSALAALVRPVGDVSPISYGSAPPLRPPRTIL